MRYPALSGILAASGFLALTEVLPGGGALLTAVVVIAALLAAAYGPRLHDAVRVSSTIVFFYFAFAMCLVGRTMAAGLDAYTSGKALEFLVLFGIWPGLTLVRLWGARHGAQLIACLVPASFLCAVMIAGAEEHLFVLKHERTGVGPTPRWTVSSHWLAYDKEAHWLYGSD